MPALTPTVEHALEVGIDMHDRLVVLTGSLEMQNPSLRLLFSAALYSLALEHFGSILLLLETGQNYGSAMALLRPLIETFTRGLWLQLCATDEEVSRIANEGRKFPELAKIGAALDTATGNGRFTLDQEFRNALHGYTHSGMEQIRHRASPEYKLEPHYSDEALLHLVQTSSLFSVYAGVFTLEMFDVPQRTSEIVDQYLSTIAPLDHET